MPVKQTCLFLIWKQRTTNSCMQISFLQDHLPTHHTMTVQEPDDEDEPDSIHSPSCGDHYLPVFSNIGSFHTIPR